MQVLVIGGGAREHAICWKILQSPLLEKLYLYDANDGFAHLGEVLHAKNYKELAQIALERTVDLAIIGPEKPLTEGVVDEFLKVNIPSIGVNQFWAALEGSKSFAKAFMERNGIKTANYQVFEKMPDDVENFSYPLVIKADGLCAGKGVKIAQNAQEAKITVKNYLDGQFGEASKTFLIEEFLDGEELSLMCLFDGNTLLNFAPCRDFKKLDNSVDSPNTGGMGAYCPVELNDIQQNKLKEFKIQLQSALIKEKADFCGIIYAGLIWAKNDFYVLEFNVRFGDPETQALLMNLENDLLAIFKMGIEKKLDKINLSYKKNPSACLIIATKGYPYKPLKGAFIKNIPTYVQTFFAGVKKSYQGIISNGGRVLSLCVTKEKPYDTLLKAADELDFEDKYYRKDLKC